MVEQTEPDATAEQAEPDATAAQAEPLAMTDEQRLAETARQTEADENLEKLKVKWAANLEKLKAKWAARSAENIRLHNLLPPQTRFHFAACHNLYAKVEELIKEGQIDINHRSVDQPNGALQTACLRGHAAVVDLLLLHGAAVEFTDARGLTALHFAVQRSGHKRYERVVKALIAHGADVNKPSASGKQPLHSAVLYAPSAIVKILLDAGADMFASDYNCRNVLHHVVLRRFGSDLVRNKICKMLLEEPMDVHGKLFLLEDYDYSGHDSEASDSEDEEPMFTPRDLAEALGRERIYHLLHIHEALCMNEIRNVKAAKLARVEADKKLNRVAFAMGGHERLGEKSSVMGLGPDVMGMILKLV